MAIPLDYETLRIIWWLLVGILLIGFALTDGYDMGVTALLPFIARNDLERRLVIASVDATWEGNQVWFIVAGASLFAAWPFVYAIAFSGFYIAMFLLLAALILRPVAFTYRDKKPDPAWRKRWDWALFIGGFVPALLFGVAVGNVLAGVPFRLDSDLRSWWEGGLFDLLTPLPLLAGLLSVAMLVLHGCGWLAIKIEQGPVLERARRWGVIAAIAAIALFAGGWAFMAFGDFGFVVTSPVDPQGPSNPLWSETARQSGAWLANYAAHPWMMLAPAMGFVGPVVALWGIVRRNDISVFAGSSVATIGIIATVGLSMYPFLLPSSLDPASSLTIFNASSSHFTLWVMLLVVVIFLPIILIYTSWVFKVLFGRVTSEEISRSEDQY